MKENCCEDDSCSSTKSWHDSLRSFNIFSIFSKLFLVIYLLISIITLYILFTVSFFLPINYNNYLNVWIFSCFICISYKLRIHNRKKDGRKIVRIIMNEGFILFIYFKEWQRMKCCFKKKYLDLKKVIHVRLSEYFITLN